MQELDDNHNVEVMLKFSNSISLIVDGGSAGAGAGRTLPLLPLPPQLRRAAHHDQAAAAGPSVLGRPIHIRPLACPLPAVGPR